MLPANRAVLEARPRFLEMVLQAPARYDIALAKNGDPVLVRRSDGRWMGSRYDPGREAERWIESQKIVDGDLPVLIGFSPAHLVALKHRSAIPAIIVEKDASLVKAALEAVDLSEHLADVTVIIDNDGFDMMSAVRNIMDPFRHVRVRVLTSPLVEDDEWEKRIAIAALDIQREVSLNAMSYAYQLPMWVETARANLEAWAESSDGGVLVNALAGQTVIIVAAGPSLDRNVGELAAFKGRALIIAVDTALRRLDKSGIIPDIAVAVDANTANAKDVVGLSREMLETILVADQIASPEIIRAFTGPRVFLRTINYTYDIEGRAVRVVQPLDQLLIDVAGRGDIPSWQSGGSVSTNAFSLAHILGARRVVFVGQDLAYTRGRSHSAGVGYEDEQFSGAGRFLSKEQQSRAMVANGDIAIEAWDGGKIKTSPVLREYLHWYEMTMERGFGGSLDVIDATEGGAKKKGMRAMRLRDVAALLDQEARPGMSGSLVSKTSKTTGTSPAEIIRRRISQATPTAASGWRSRMEAISLLAASFAGETTGLLSGGVSSGDPDEIADKLPLARWLSLPAYLGSRDFPDDARRALIRSVLVQSARFIAAVWK